MYTSAPKRAGHLMVAGSRAQLMERLVRRPDVVLGHPNFRGVLADLLPENDDRLRLIATREGFALWSPLGANSQHDPAILPAMVEVRVRNLGKRSALTLRRRMHPRTMANLVSSICIFMMWTSLLVFSPHLWVALLMLPAFLVLPIMCARQSLIARARDRRAWDTLTETFIPLELAPSTSDAPFRVPDGRP